MHRIFSAEIDQLHLMLPWIREEARRVGFDSSALHKIELACEEALVNIIHHTYENQKGEVEIEVCSFPKSHVEIIIKDRGAPFNPLEAEEVDPSQSLEDREIGGLGIHLMRQCMDELQYRYESKANILTLIKNYSTHSSQKK